MVYRKILLVDDDVEDQEIFKNALSAISTEFEFFSYTSSVISLEDLLQKKVCPDIIFLDLNMPLLNGEEFLFKLKSNPENIDTPVIIISTSSNSNTINKTKELGAIDFIIKPDRFDKLVTLLKNILS